MQNEYTPIYMDGNNILYIEDIVQNGKDARKTITLNKNQISEMFAPILSIGRAIKNDLETIDEAELCMQCSMRLESGKLVLGLVSSSVEAQISLKLVVKNSNKV